MKTTALVGGIGARTLLDGGASRSYVSLEMARRLGNLGKMEKPGFVKQGQSIGKASGVVRKVRVRTPGFDGMMELWAIKDLPYDLVLGRDWLKDKVITDWTKNTVTINGHTVQRKEAEKEPAMFENLISENELINAVETQQVQETHLLLLEHAETEAPELEATTLEEKITFGDEVPDWFKEKVMHGKYAALWSDKMPTYPPDRIVKHKIELKPDAKPVVVRYGRRGPAEAQAIEEKVNELLERGLIERAESEWCTPLLVVKKKDGKVRIVQDLRKINEMTKKSNFPIADINELLETAARGRWYSVTDIGAAYHTIELDEESRDLTAFQAGRFQYRWTTMTQGLCNAPQTWARYCATILSDMMDEGWLNTFFDDNCIATDSSIEDHCDKVCRFLDRRLEKQLKLRPGKTSFGVDKVEFLGHEISAGSIKPMQSKVEAINRIPGAEDDQAAAQPDRHAVILSALDQGVCDAGGAVDRHAAQGEGEEGRSDCVE